MATSLQEIAANTQGLGSGTGSVVTELQSIVSALGALAGSWTEVTLTSSGGITVNSAHMYVHDHIGLVAVDYQNDTGAAIASGTVIFTIPSGTMGGRSTVANAVGGGSTIQAWGTDISLAANMGAGAQHRGLLHVYYNS